MHSKFVRTSILALSALSVGACAPVGLEKTAEIENMARQALSEARDAAEKANNALSVASEASYSATKAQSTAESALNCCNENRDKIDRALERVTRK
ncbi:MAG: alanine-zipper protein [Gammaproteobacteria bacterium]|nr:alanine-zipper protein [Gammaproteobacteria bacterium]MDD9863438.1 alanine-zipper protein [Gammaproteobacteria bacterium]